MEQQKGYVDSDYLQMVAELTEHVKKRSYENMHLKVGQKVLDLGCGTGIDTIALAQLVGETGRVVGVDYDSAMISEANDRANEAGVAMWVEHRLTDVEVLPFPSEEFDSCRSERVFQHLLHPAQVLSEMSRVVRRNGWVVVVDTDWGTLSTDTSQTDIERRLARVISEHTHNNGYAGRQLYRLFKQQGLVDISIELFPLYVTDYTLGRQGALLDEVEQEALSMGVITKDELELLHRNLEKADAAGTYFSTVCQVMIAGRKV